jgi:hypothetical protein
MSVGKEILTDDVRKHMQIILNYLWDDESKDYANDSAPDNALDEDGDLDLDEVCKDMDSNHIFVSVAVVQNWLGYEAGYESRTKAFLDHVRELCAKDGSTTA